MLTKKQVKTFRAERNGVVAIAKVRYDDECGNGHNTFAITCDVYDRERANGEPSVTLANGKRRWLGSCGCCHAEVKRFFPKLAPFIKWHLVSSDGPMHYVANTRYHASNRDHWGLLKGERRQIRNGRTGKLAWILESDKELKKNIDSDERPTETATLRYVPWCHVGEGKERNLDAARSVAVWPDATEEELTSPDLEQKLMDRLPALMAEFRKDIESLGFVF